MKKAEKTSPDRLRRILSSNYFHIPNDTFEALKADLTRILSSYFEELAPEIDLSVENTGTEYRIALVARAATIKDLKIL